MLKVNLWFPHLQPAVRVTLGPGFPVPVPNADARVVVPDADARVDIELEKPDSSDSRLAAAANKSDIAMLIWSC